jgi:hypothetical protein
MLTCINLPQNARSEGLPKATYKSSQRLLTVHPLLQGWGGGA